MNRLLVAADHAARFTDRDPVHSDTFQSVDADCEDAHFRASPKLSK
jgi:hypothetical protein